MNSNEMCSEAIKEAVEWLDLNMPEWYKKIDLTKFEFISTTRCIAGQLQLSMNVVPGFDTPLSTDHQDFDWSYAFMDTLWREIVSTRADKAVNFFRKEQ